MIFLDTNVVSEFMRPRPHEPVLAWLEKNGPTLALSAIVIAEVHFGIERIRPAERAPRLAKALDTLRQRFTSRIHAFDEESAMIYGAIKAKAVREGRPIATADGMIAAIALRHDARLATRNTADFRFLGLNTLNPWE